MVEDHFRESYSKGDTPWDVGEPDFNLIQAVTTTPIQPCRAWDIGCGTGDNAIWLTQQKFDVVGIDTSEIAIGKAREKAANAKVTCCFLMQNVFTTHIEGPPFGFAFDRGCFHVFDSDDERRRFAEQVHRHLRESGLWLSLAGGADEERKGQGPPQRTARDIVNAVEPYFEILSLVTSHFETKLPFQPRAWVCLMRKRGSGR